MVFLLGIVKFAPDGKILAEFGRPDEPIFGETSPFTPRKISVDVRGNMYVIGEGATAGIIQMNAVGDFLGYYGANEAPTNFLQVIRDNLLSEIQQSKVFRNVPPATSNIDINDKGIVYTVTTTAETNNIKKLNVAGANMLDEGTEQPENAIDIASGLYDNFYVLTSEGEVIEYSDQGSILFKFGKRDSGSQRLGVYNSPSAIGIDEQGTLYVVDSEAKLIHKLKTTEFADEIHKGLILYEDGKYTESEEYWKNVINMNPSFKMARYALGESYFQREKYSQALNSFETAKDIPAYSDTFWEIRNDWFQKSLGMTLFIIIVLFILFKVVNYLVKRKTGKTLYQMFKERTSKRKLLRELGYVFRMFRHPLDTLYEIQNLGKSSVTAASIIYGILVIEFILFNYFTGFIFNYKLLESYNIFMLVLLFILSFALLISMNYMVSTMIF